MSDCSAKLRLFSTKCSPAAPLFFFQYGKSFLQYGKVFIQYGENAFAKWKKQSHFEGNLKKTVPF